MDTNNKPKRRRRKQEKIKVLLETQILLALEKNEVNIKDIISLYLRLLPKPPKVKDSVDGDESTDDLLKAIKDSIG